MIERVILIAPEPPPFGGMANQARLLAECFVKEGVQVFFIPTNRLPDLFAEKLWTLPVFRTFGKFFMYLAGIFGSVRQARIIHIMACSHVYFYLNVIPAVIIGRIFKKKVVVNYRGGEAEVFFKGLSRYFLWVFSLADSVIVPSGFLQSVFHKLGVNTIVIPNISEIERFQFFMPDYSNPVKFICTRNFEPYYDILTLVKSFALIKKKLPRSTLTLIGEGSLKQDIQNHVEQSGLCKSVSFLGKVDPRDMPDQLSCHDIYVNSSVVDNYPISLLEAFSCGLPVVSTDAGGIPYMVEQGKSGILVPIKDHNALANEMIRVAEDPDLGKYLAKNAKKFADAHSWEKIWVNLRAQYQ